MDSSCGLRQRRSAAIYVDRESDMIDPLATHQAISRPSMGSQVLSSSGLRERRSAAVYVDRESDCSSPRGRIGDLSFQDDAQYAVESSPCQQLPWMTSPATVLHIEPSPVVSFGDQVADKESRLRCARRLAPLDVLYELDKVEETITVRVEDIVSSLQLDSQQRQQDYVKDIAAECKEFALLLACGLQQPQDVPDAERLFRSHDLSGEDARRTILDVQNVVDSYTLEKALR